MIDKIAFAAAVEWARRLDHREVSDAAHAWADVDAAWVGMPANVGELKAMLAVAFDVGRNYTERSSTSR